MTNVEKEYNRYFASPENIPITFNYGDPPLRRTGKMTAAPDGAENIKTKGGVDVLLLGIRLGFVSKNNKKCFFVQTKPQKSRKMDGIPTIHFAGTAHLQANATPPFSLEKRSRSGQSAYVKRFSASRYSPRPPSRLKYPQSRRHSRRI